MRVVDDDMLLGEPEFHALWSCTQKTSQFICNSHGLYCNLNILYEGTHRSIFCNLPPFQQMIHLRVLHLRFLFEHMELSQELIDISTILLIGKEFLI